MSASHALKKRTEFLTVREKGAAWACPYFILTAYAHLPHSSVQKLWRVGFTVSKKVGNAVQRNRVRRRLRALVAYCFPPKACAGWDYVIIGRVATITAPWKNMVIAMNKALLSIEYKVNCLHGSHSSKHTHHFAMAAIEN